VDAPIDSRTRAQAGEGIRKRFNMGAMFWRRELRNAKYFAV